MDQPPSNYNPNESVLSGGIDVPIMKVMGGGGEGVAPDGYNETQSLLSGGLDAPIIKIEGGAVAQPPPPPPGGLGGIAGPPPPPGGTGGIAGPPPPPGGTGVVPPPPKQPPAAGAPAAGAPAAGAPAAGAPPPPSYEEIQIINDYTRIADTNDLNEYNSLETYIKNNNISNYITQLNNSIQTVSIPKYSVIRNAIVAYGAAPAPAPASTATAAAAAPAAAKEIIIKFINKNINTIIVLPDVNDGYHFFLQIKYLIKSGYCSITSGYKYKIKKDTCVISYIDINKPRVAPGALVAPVAPGAPPILQPARQSTPINDMISYMFLGIKKSNINNFFSVNEDEKLIIILVIMNYYQLL